MKPLVLGETLAVLEYAGISRRPLLIMPGVIDKATVKKHAVPAAVLQHLLWDIAAGGFGQALELVDGAALLWRLYLLGHDGGGRWSRLADKWESRIDDGYYAFNDAHAMMAFVGADRRTVQDRLLAAITRAATGTGTNGMMAREVGVPVVQGLAAFGRGDYAKTIALLLPVRAKANRFGGSHAQRDVLSWTLVEAALRTGDRALADALIAERLALKPKSPLNLGWADRAQRLAVRAAA